MLFDCRSTRSDTPKWLLRLKLLFGFVDYNDVNSQVDIASTNVSKNEWPTFVFQPHFYLVWVIDNCVKALRQFLFNQPIHSISKKYQLPKIWECLLSFFMGPIHITDTPSTYVTFIVLLDMTVSVPSPTSNIVAVRLSKKTTKKQPAHCNDTARILCVSLFGLRNNRSRHYHQVNQMISIRTMHSNFNLLKIVCE